VATHGLIIRDWHPTPLNRLVGCHYGTRSRRKRFDRDLVAATALAGRVPKAAGKRRVGVRIVLGPRQRGCDPDAYWKSLLDALVACGLLLNDGRQGVELGAVRFDRDAKPRTEITLEDL
jgi:Holliday junction resolvase RusA-like endonuclease